MNKLPSHFAQKCPICLAIWNSKGRCLVCNLEVYHYKSHLDYDITKDLSNNFYIRWFSDGDVAYRSYKTYEWITIANDVNIPFNITLSQLETIINFS